MTAPTPSAGERAVAETVVEEIMRRAAVPHTGSFAGDAAAWPNAGIEAAEVVDLIAHALATARAEGAQAERARSIKALAIALSEVNWTQTERAHVLAALAGEATDG